jgi:hypothetical protein
MTRVLSADGAILQNRLIAKATAFVVSLVNFRSCAMTAVKELELWDLARPGRHSD